MNETTDNLPRISVRDLLFVLFSKKRVFVGTLIVVIVAILGGTILRGRIYEVSSRILVKPIVESSFKFNVPPWGVVNANPVTSQDINSEIGIMLSDDLLRKVVTRLNLDKPQMHESYLDWIFDKMFGFLAQQNDVDRAVINLRNRLKVEPQTMSNLIIVTLRGGNPEIITKIVNALVDLYIDEHIAVHKVEGGVDFFTDQTNFFGDRLKESEKNLQEFQKEWSVNDIVAQRDGNLKVLETLKSNLANVNAEIALIHTKLEEAKKEPNASIEEYRQSAVLEEMTKNYLPLLVERERIAMLYPKNSVEYKDINEQLGRVVKNIAKEQQLILDGRKIDLSSLMGQAEAISHEIDRIEGQNQFLTEKEIEIDRLKRDLKQNEKLYLLYQEKTEESRIEDQKERARVANVTVASWATVPTVPVFPKMLLMIVISVFLGLIIGLAAAFVAYYVDHTVKSPEDLPRHAQIKALASIELMEMPRSVK